MSLKYLTIFSQDSTLLGFYFESSHFKVGIMLYREDNGKVSEDNFFFNFPGNANENSESPDIFKPVYLSLLLKVLSEIQAFSLWPRSFFFQIDVGEVISVLIDFKYF